MTVPVEVPTRDLIDRLHELRDDAPFDTSVSSAADVSVVICAYTTQRWQLLRSAVESVESQVVPRRPDVAGRRPGGAPGGVEIVIVVDHSPDLLMSARDEWPHHIVTENASTRGLSGARNTGIARSSGSIVVFLDDDASAEPGWLARLVRHFDDPHVWGVGGHVEPRYLDGDPTWLPEEFGWVIGCSYRGQPSAVAEVRNPIGANMAFRRSAFDTVGGFRDGIGRVGRTPLGCEETEFAIRVRRQGGLVLHDPDARVRHAVSGDRVGLGYFVRRCWAEGVSKAIVAGLAGTDAALSAERSYVMNVLPAALGSALRTAVVGPGRRSAMARGAAVLTGATVTAAGYARGRATSMLQVGARG